MVWDSLNVEKISLIFVEEKQILEKNDKIEQGKKYYRWQKNSNLSHCKFNSNMMVWWYSGK